tara:strand:+ start:8199 stop:8432 length:234 start_codon:yes stop_codon:yes gene_type:complete
MKASVIIGNNAYAVIKGEGFSMDVLLNPGRGAWQSLRESAIEEKNKAAAMIVRADRMLEAASILENEHNAKVKRDAA